MSSIPNLDRDTLARLAVDAILDLEIAIDDTTHEIDRPVETLAALVRERDVLARRFGGQPSAA